MSDVDARYERPHARGGANLRRAAFREQLEKRELTGASRSYLKRSHFESKRYTNFKGDVSKKTTMTKAKSSLRPGHGTKQSEDGPPAKKKKVAPPVAAHGPECLVYLTDIPKEATEQEVINLAGSFGPINNVLLMPSHDEDEDRGQQASVCMIKAEDAQTFANAPNLLIRDRVITATVAKNPEEQISDAESSMKPEQQGGGGDHTFEKKKGVVLIEDLPESGWTEEHLRALAEPFGYPDDIIVAKQIGKALLIMPDIETAQEMVKVHSFSPASINQHNVVVKNVYRNINTHTPVALYNLLMHSVDGAVSAARGAVGWGMLVVVSNVPQTPSSAYIVHKLVSRIGTVFKTLAVNNVVICEMATGPLATAVYRHYLKFPCMIQNNPLVFSRRPDPKTPLKVIPAFLDTDKDVPEEKKEPPPTAAAKQNDSSANPEPKEIEVKAAEIKCEQVEETVVPQEENPEENVTTITTIITKEEPMETTMEEVVNTELTVEAVKTEPTEKDQTSDVEPKENGAEVQTVEEATIAASAEGEAAAQNTTSDANVPTAVSAEKETPVKAPKPSPQSAAQKRTSREKSKDLSKNSHRSSISSGREDERRRSDRDTREKESRDRERRERERERTRKDRDYDERSKRDYERERRSDSRREDSRREDSRREDSRREDSRREDSRREDSRREDSRREGSRKDDPRRDDAKREEMKRAWRREWERREGKRRPYGDSDLKRSDGTKRSHHRDRDERYKSSSERKTIDDDFPFNLSDFVTVDEVGDVDSEAPTETGPDAGLELGSDSKPELELGSEPKSELELGSEPGQGQELESDSKPELEQGSETALETGLETQTEESLESRPPENLPLETEEKALDIPMEVSGEDPEKTEAEMTEERPEAQTAEDDAKETTVLEDVTEEAQTAEGAVSESTDETCPAASQETNQDEPANAPQQDPAEVTAPAIPEQEELKEEVSATEKDKEEKQKDSTSAPPAEPEKSENGVKDVTVKAQRDKTLPPFDASSSVGLEYLVPMTGFFCKVCTRFFTGAKDSQIGHSKTLKHYENLEKFLKSSSADGAGST